MITAMPGRSWLPLQLLVLFALLFGLTACGKKGPVRPLLRAEPAAPGRPEARQIGGEIVLSVDLPERNLDGSLLTDLSELRIFRRETSGGPCSECDEPTELWRTIDLLTRSGSGGRLVIRDGDVLPGFGYRYLLVPVTSRGQSGATAALSRQIAPFPPPPREIIATPFDRMVRLQWSLGGELAPGWTDLGCQLYRGQGDAPLGMTPLTSSPILGGRFDDFGTHNGTLYRYQLRCLAGKEGIVVDSPPSVIVSATPQPE